MIEHEHTNCRPIFTIVETEKYPISQSRLLTVAPKNSMTRIDPSLSLVFGK